jgi:carboxylesterase type B
MKNYQYEIEKKNNEIRVFEFISTHGSRVGTLWDIDKLKKSLDELDKNKFLSRDIEDVISSFKRTKEWVLKNHPELLL